MSTLHTAASVDPTRSSTLPLANRLVRGAVAGLVGGMVFGMMMQMMGMITTIAMLVGSHSVPVGWLVHLVVSAGLGAGFGLVVGTRVGTWPAGLGLGVAYGMVWWVLGGLIAMPLALGMPVMHLDVMAWESLMGHMIYGAVLGLVAHLLGRHSA